MKIMIRGKIEKDVFFVLSRAWDKEKKMLSLHEESNLRPSDSALQCSTVILEMWGFEDHRKGRTDFRGRIKSLRDPRFFKATLAAPYGNKGWSAWPISEHCDPPIAHNQSAKYSDTFAFNLWPDIKKQFGRDFNKSRLPTVYHHLEDHLPPSVQPATRLSCLGFDLRHNHLHNRPLLMENFIDTS